MKKIFFSKISPTPLQGFQSEKNPPTPLQGLHMKFFFVIFKQVIYDSK
jgi:hypothetical protein